MTTHASRASKTGLWRPVAAAVALQITGAVFQPSAAQLPFAVPLVTWDSATLDRQRAVYRTEASKHELLFCVTEWSLQPGPDGVDLIVIRRVSRERTGGPHAVMDVGRACNRAHGALPIIHTHSDGNCQFSPNDLITLIARAAPFEGVQCGDRYFVWQFARQLQAMANEFERERWQAERRRAP